ncbi:MAG: GntR family transcriptional regulator [Eubacterium sp.]|nr:GntR family transcriptional regulator [Eubacterium sp.]
MIIQLDFDSPEAIYIQLRNQIVMLIAQSQLRDGDSLPSVRNMAVRLGVNMHTVNKAYAMLRQEGFLTLDRRNGAVISVRAEDKQREIGKINKNMQLLVAQAICKDVQKEEMLRLIEEMYDAFL